MIHFIRLLRIAARFALPRSSNDIRISLLRRFAPHQLLCSCHLAFAMCTHVRVQARNMRARGKLSLIWTSPRSISDTPLNALLHLHSCPIYLIVSQGSYSYDGISHLEGGFTLRCLQRLSLPDLATLLWRWSPTGTPVVRPSRSSRTKDSSSQISYAYAG